MKKRNLLGVGCVILLMPVACNAPEDGMIQKNDTTAVDAAYKELHQELSMEAGAGKGMARIATAPIDIESGRRYIKNYIDHFEKCFDTTGWLVNNLLLKNIVDDPLNKYTHISMAIKPGNVITVVLSGVTANYQHHLLAGNQVLETVHPCPDCHDYFSQNDEEKSAHASDTLAEASVPNAPRP